jgi:hypothetical protein
MVPTQRSANAFALDDLARVDDAVLVGLRADPGAVDRDQTDPH